MLSGRHHRMNPRAGQTVVFTTISMFFLMTVMGLAVDLGYSYFKKLHAQTAADAAAGAATAYAGANGSTCGTGGVVCGTTYNCASPATTPPTTAMQAGCLYAEANGFSNTGNQAVSLIANNTTPPNETGNFPAYWVQANVMETVPHLFLYWAGFRSGAVAAQAMGGITIVPASSCVYVLDSGSTQDALLVSGSSSLIASGCGIYVNSSHGTKAIDVTGSSSISGTQIKVKGGYTVSGSSTSTPTPTAGSAVIADPFGSLPAPTFSGCDHTNYSTASNATINPGVYCGGITVTGSAHVTFNSGIYIVNGGGFNIGNSGIVTGANVMFFLTGQNGQTPAGMQLTGSSILTLSPPASGTYQGVLFYQDRSVTYATSNLLGASSVLHATGSFYFPTTKMTFSGSVSASKIALISKTLSITGSSTLTQDTTGAFTGLASRSAGLIQ